MSIKALVKKMLIKLDEYAPEILVGIGIAGTVNGTIMACKATTKLEAIKAETERKELEIKTFIDDDYSEEDRASDLIINSRRGKLEIIKNYIPAALVTTAGIASIVTGVVILDNRNTAIKGAFNSVLAEFAAYRKDIVEKFGEDVDKNIKFKITEKVDEETGEAIEVSEKDDGIDPTCFFIGAGDFGYDDCPEITLDWINKSLWELDSDFKKYGYLLLSDVYKKFGKKIPNEKALKLGWVLRPNDPKFHNSIDCGLKTTKRGRSETCEFLNGNADGIWLEWNVDGDISAYI